MRDDGTPVTPDVAQAGTHVERNRFADPVNARLASPLPIAIVMTSFDPGGTENQMLELVRRLDRSRWTVHLACLHARGAWLDRAVAAADTITEFPISSLRRPATGRQALAFRRWCTRHRIALVHATDFYTNIFALPAAALARVPVRIGNRRGVNADRSLAQIALQRAAYSCAHTIVANSTAMAARLRFERIAAARIAVIPNGLDTDVFRPVLPPSRRRRVIVVSNLRPEKGHDVLIDAAVVILQRFPDARFDLVGAGPELPAIRARLAARGIENAFTLLGQRDDVAALLAGADIAVLPSRTESLPNSVLEAMATGLPVVASAVGGIPDVIDDGRTGRLVPAGDPSALASAICGLMDDPSVGTRLGGAARAEVLGRFSFSRMVSAMETLYIDEVTRRGRQHAAVVA